MGKILFLISVLLPFISYGQLKPFPGPVRTLTEEEEATSERNFHCIHQDKYSLKERLAFIPFSKATHIKLISFKQPPQVVMGGQVPTRKGYVDYAKAEQILTLSASQVDTLTDILYNTGYKGIFHLYSEAKCYEPRNAIVFEDVKGRGFAFIELCFACEGYRVSAKTVNAGDFCAEKFALLEAFFAQAGIKYGIKPELSQEEKQ